MKPLTCEMCGSTNIIKQDGLFVCQSCGTKYSVEEARKMMIDGTVSIEGTVKIDSSAELNNLYEVARRAREMDNDQKAEEYYERIILKDPKSWEANFYVTYYRVKRSNLNNIGSSCSGMLKSIPFILNLLQEQFVLDEQIKILQQIQLDLIKLGVYLNKPLFSNYEDVSFSVKVSHLRSYINDVQSYRILYLLGDEILKFSPYNPQIVLLSVKTWDEATVLHNQCLEYFSESDEKELMIKYIDKIKKYAPEYKPQVGSKFEINEPNLFKLWRMWNI